MPSKVVDVLSYRRSALFKGGGHSSWDFNFISTRENREKSISWIQTERIEEAAKRCDILCIERQDEQNTTKRTTRNSPRSFRQNTMSNKNTNTGKTVKITSDIARKIDKRVASVLAIVTDKESFVKGGLGMAQKLFAVDLDGALMWLLDWRARGFLVSALAGRAADLYAATFNGAEKAVNVRTGKGKVTVWRVRISSCGKFYERQHKDNVSERKVRGMVECLDAITVA